MLVDSFHVAKMTAQIILVPTEAQPVYGDGGQETLAFRCKPVNIAFLDLLLQAQEAPGFRNVFESDYFRHEIYEFSAQIINIFSAEFFLGIYAQIAHELERPEH